jgi:hypothetical protein
VSSVMTYSLKIIVWAVFSVTTAENTRGILIIYFIIFYTISIPFFLACSFPVLYFTEWYAEADI